MKQMFKPANFAAATRDTIAKANAILEEYRQQGFTLTLRQLYYQFVARGFIENSLKSYKRIGEIINDARLAGEIDWALMEDRTRNLMSLSSWSTPASIIESAAYGYRMNPWLDQRYYVEVWFEKDALAGVFSPACNGWRVPYLSCRGYCSQSEMYDAGKRLAAKVSEGKTPVVLYFGDHDPSGKDMSRDILDRLTMFMGGLRLDRLALNMDQIEAHSPPPNPAKITDSRARAYIAEFGEDSWELDALEPTVLAGLVNTAVEALVDRKKWDATIKEEKAGRKLLTACADKWDDVREFLRQQ